MAIKKTEFHIMTEIKSSIQQKVFHEHFWKLIFFWDLELWEERTKQIRGSSTLLKLSLSSYDASEDTWWESTSESPPFIGTKACLAVIALNGYSSVHPSYTIQIIYETLLNISKLTLL